MSVASAAAGVAFFAADLSSEALGATGFTTVFLVTVVFLGAADFSSAVAVCAFVAVFGEDLAGAASDLAGASSRFLVTTFRAPASSFFFTSGFAFSGCLGSVAAIRSRAVRI